MMHLKRLRLSRRYRYRRLLSVVITALMLLVLVVMAKVTPWHTSLLQTVVFSHTSQTSTPFTIGAFLHNQQASNNSYCLFPFGTADNFTIPDEVFGSPELGDKGPYRVVYNVVLGRAYNESRLSVTFATHATLEYIVHIAEMTRAWDGPVSVGCFLPYTDLSIALTVLERLCSCEPAMWNVSVHLVFHTEHTPNATQWGESLDDSCYVPPQWLQSSRTSLGLPYPVNVARNVARVAARTEHILVADIELFPSAGLPAGFLQMLDNIPERSTGHHSFLKKRHVYVVPVFEVAADVERLPRTKRELLKLHADDRAVYFHRFVCLHCQQFPGLKVWLQRRTNPRSHASSVHPMLVVKREFPHHRWEPIYIGTQREPLYSELLTWEGQQDKMTQMYEMCLLGYRFVILDGAFLVHTPGVKTRKKKKPKNTLSAPNTTIITLPTTQSVQMKRNSYLYKLITQDLMSKYNDNAHCRKH